jgi:alkaline phosphatase
MTAVIALPPPIKQVPNHYRSISIHIGMVREEKISGNWTGVVDSSSGRGNHATPVAGLGLHVERRRTQATVAPANGCYGEERQDYISTGREGKPSKGLVILI